MGIYHGKNARMFINGYDISALAVALTPDQEMELKPYAVMDGVNGYHQLTGLAKDTLKVEGIFDDNYTAVLNSLFTASAGYQIVIPFGQTQGDRGLAIAEAKLNKYVWSSVVTDINKLSADLLGDNAPWDEIKMLEQKRSVTSGGSGTALNETASASGCEAYLQVFAVNAGDTLTVSIRHSTDNFVASDDELIAFTGATGITTERKTTASTVRQYIKAQWAGATGTCTFALAWKRI